VRRAPAPEIVAAEMSKVVRMAEKIADMAEAVVEEYAELDDGAYRREGNGGFEKPISSGDFRATDPTGDVAASGQHERMRYQMRETDRHFRKIRPHLERALTQMLEAWLEHDPEAQERIRRRRQLEDEIAETRQSG